MEKSTSRGTPLDFRICNKEDTESEKCVLSWSWASTRSGGITYDYKDKKFKVDIEIVSVGIQFSSSNTFGGVFGGKLEIKAVLIPIQAKSGWPESISLYRIIESKEKEWTLGNDEINLHIDPYHYGPNKPTESAIKVKRNISLFFMFVGTRKFRHYTENPSFLALRYLEEDERRNSMFMRAGIAPVDERSMNFLGRVRAGTKESIVLI